MVSENLYCLTLFVTLFLFVGTVHFFCSNKGLFLKLSSGIFAMSGECLYRDTYAKDCKKTAVRLFYVHFNEFSPCCLFKLLFADIALQKSCRLLTNSL